MQYFNNCCIIKTMDKTTATTAFESLSSGVRLDVFRLLVKQGYRANLGLMMELITYLTEECCSGQEQCIPHTICSECADPVTEGS
jgi:hypothetical protein